MEIKIPYTPHSRQREIHQSNARFKIVAAGRRSGKTTLAVNELIKQAINHPQRENAPIERSWFICSTYKQAEMVGWRTMLKYLPEELIKYKRGAPALGIELTNGHVLEFKGAQDYDKLRGVSLRHVVLDEYGLMDEAVWTDIIRPMLVDTKGSALFIGTPGADGSPHFHDIFNMGKSGSPSYESWLFFSTDNPTLDPAEIQEARNTMPPDIFKREFEASFDVTAGLIYDNFNRAIHVIPNHEPNGTDFIVGSIDPGLTNPTAAILTAWDSHGIGRIFKEYYVEDKLASENALELQRLAKPYRVSYWVIDRASNRRDMATGITVLGKYQEVLGRVLTAPNDPGSVWAGIDQMKSLIHQKKLLVSAMCHNWLWEISRYIRYKRKWHAEKNEEEKPRKLHDHLMDATRNMIMTKPWARPSLRMHIPRKTAYPI